MTQTDWGAGIQKCGHGKPVMTQNGEWFMVYLCGRKLGGKYSILGRETAMDPITWTADGWPIVNMLKGPSSIQKKPNLPEVILENDCRLDLNRKELSPVWLTPRILEKDAIRIENGLLLLKGSAEPLLSVHNRNTLLRRQTDFKFTATADFVVQTMEDHQNEGLVGYYDEYSWVSFGMHKTEKGYCIKLWQHIGFEDITHEEHMVDCEGEIISYRMDVEYYKRSFSYKIGNGAWIPYKTLDNMCYLSDEGVSMGSRFTGTLVGMYAYAGRKPYTAHIAGFVYESRE